MAGVLLSACEQARTAAADARLGRSQWRLVSVDGQTLPLDTTKVGQFPLEETLRIESASAVVTTRLLSRDMQNRREESRVTVDGTLMVSGGCGKFVFAGSKEETATRERIRADLRQIITTSMPVNGMQGQLPDRALEMTISGDTLTLSDDCSSGIGSRVYARTQH